MEQWPTGITDIEQGDIFVRGYPIARLIGRTSFPNSLFLLLTGDLPSAPASRLVEAVLVAALDHGTTSPSALAARTVVSGGAPVQVGAAAGLLALNKYHGAAVEGAARLLARVGGDAGADLGEAAAAAVGDLLARGERVPGFGHRVHRRDPRVDRLFAVAREAAADERFIDAARAVEAALEAAKGRHFPMNLDTAIAAVLLPYMDPGQVLGVFVVSRLCGIYAQANEEATRMKPMRRIEPSAWMYDGPPRRGAEG